MKLSSLRRTRATAPAGVSGAARIDRQTRSIVKRARPGDIAIIDHVDIDRASASALVEARVAAVVNVAPSVSGRYPNLGPELLLAAGVPLVDNVDPAVFSTVNDGDIIRVTGGDIFRGDDRIATGSPQDQDSVASSLEASKAGMATQLEALRANVLEYSTREWALLVDGKGVPSTKVSFEDRHVVVVQRAYDYRGDLRSLKAYIRENDPLFVAIGDGAEVLLEAGYRPDVIMTDADAADVSDSTLRCGAEVVFCAATGDRTERLDRLERLGVDAKLFVTSGTGEDAALVLAHAQRAKLMVLVGSPRTLAELMDTGRAGMASTLVTRASAGADVVHANVVAQLYANRVRTWLVLVLIVLGLCLVAAAIATTPIGQDWWDQLTSWLNDTSKRLGDRL
jgi:uncharacterized membrane-anchored protein